jgi:dipeptidyl aminopeptidase/acylaminoacyl peptidase
MYLLQKMNASTYPNLCVTGDFKSFHPVSDLAPERQVNWLTDELVHWKTFDGRSGEGILYKPADFDSIRKYPIIFYFYERLSDGLNNFIHPEWSNGTMNIPWFVSRGYLVCCPDIYYIAGDPGKGIYNYVVSAAMDLSRKSWVDSRRMGIQGHSWGGYEVNYLVTTTRLFAAAASTAGFTDIISNSGAAGMGNCAGHVYTEFGQLRMGVPLWDNPTAYIQNSPVFRADKITTPVLIMHNRQDPAVPWSQGVEFFTALRRLGKPCWMLQYDDGSHIIGGSAAIDYTRRLTQFFDHYLKGVPAPKWMTEGVPARLKAVDSGLKIPSAMSSGK